jgi:hypothetical protein
MTRLRTPDGDKIFDVIRHHIGDENAIGAREICRELGWPIGSARHVRRIIAAESPEWQGIVCAHAGDPAGGGGFFIASTYLEIEAYWAFLDDLRSAAALKVTRFENLCYRMGIRLTETKEAA